MGFALKETGNTAKKIALYSSSNIYRQILKVFTAFIKPKLLSPDLFGLYNLLSIIPTYASYSHLGARTSMVYKTPYYLASNDMTKSREIYSTVYKGSFYMTLLLVIAIVMTAIIGNFTTEEKWGLLATAAVVMIGWYYEYFIAVLKSKQTFSLITSSNYIKATFTFVLSISLIYFFRIYGVYLTMVLSLLIVVFYLRLKYRPEPSVKFKPILFFELIKHGFPIMIFNLIVALIITSDRVVISLFLGNRELGYYGIAIMVFNFLMNIPNVARTVIEPKLMQEMQSESREESLKKYFLSPLFNTAYYMPILAVPVFFILPPVIPLLLPRYTPGIEPSQILIIGCYFLALAHVSRGIIVANNLQIKALGIAFCVLILNISVSSILAIKGFGINSIAICSTISFFIFFISLFVFVKRIYKKDYKEWNFIFRGLLLPISITAGYLLIINYIDNRFLINEFIKTITCLILYSIIMVVMYLHAQKRYSLLKKIRLP